MSQVRKVLEDEASGSLSEPVDWQLRKTMRMPIGTLFGVLHRKADADTNLSPEMPIWFPDRHANRQKKIRFGDAIDVLQEVYRGEAEYENEISEFIRHIFCGNSSTVQKLCVSMGALLVLERPAPPLLNALLGHSR